MSVSQANRKLRGAMVGGGFNSFIGPVHRMAGIMDGQADFAGGVFSSDAARSREFGATLFLNPARVHGSVADLLHAERALPPTERIDFVTICTPNDAHYDAVCAVLEAGFHVICDKPITRDLAQAKDLARRIEASGLFFGLTHNYTGYPMVKQARHLVQSGALGTIHKVVVEYPQGWLAPLLNNTDPARNPWRMDPARVGKACSMGDIGTHAENLVRYITGLKIAEVCAELSANVPSNPLEDDGNILVRYHGGARGVMIASQTSTGEENGFNIKVYGSDSSLYWCQEDPNYLTVRSADGFKTVYSKGSPQLCPAALSAGRLPLGHPDGFIEAFANLYLESYRAIRSAQAGQALPHVDVPGAEDGVIGMQFIETVVASAHSAAKWTRWVE